MVLAGYQQQYCAREQVPHRNETRIALMGGEGRGRILTIRHAWIMADILGGTNRRAVVTSSIALLRRDNRLYGECTCSWKVLFVDLNLKMPTSRTDRLCDGAKDARTSHHGSAWSGTGSLVCQQHSLSCIFGAPSTG